MQWDYGDGPSVQGRATTLFCAWLAWSASGRLALWERRCPSVVSASTGRCARSGIADLRLTERETVSVDHVCVIAVRNPQIVSVGRHYGLTIATCVR